MNPKRKTQNHHLLNLTEGQMLFVLSDLNTLTEAE